MKGLAELVVSLCDLCEAEGRLLEAGILRTVRRVGLLSLGLLFGAAALALLLAALYALLTSLLPTPAALALLGGASAVIAASLLWGARGAAAQGGGKAEENGSGAGAGEAPPTPKPAGAPTPKPAAVQPPEEPRAPWTQVAPYGPGAAPAAPARTGKGARLKGGAGMREKR